MTDATTRGHWHIPWLRGLPEHWGVASSKQLFSARKELARSQDRQLAATQAYGVISQKEFEQRVGRRVVQITQNLEKRRHVEKDDFVISMRSFQGGLERAWETGCIRSSYVVLKPSERVDSGFFQYVFKSHEYIQALQATSNFIRDGQDLNMSNFSLVDLPLPPKDEQMLLARFLDWHGAQTAKLVRAKKKVIALLNEQKQAIIHRAVTRGLDPNAKLKPSGIPWLGDVPEGWEVKRLRNVAELRVSNIDKKSFDDEQKVRLCNYVDVYKNDVIHADIAFMEATASQAEIERFRLRIGDVIITKDSEDWKDIGVPALVATEAEDLVCAYHLALLRPIASQTDGAFLFWHLLSADVRRQFAIAANGVTRYGLSHGSIKELVLACPDLAEQRAIAAHLDAATANISSSERGIQREIALIQEFRTRLIADVVTGKLDVRAAAASLPEVTEIEPVDYLAEGDDLDEAIDATENEEVAA
jgi:type I restriction enzyme S subunit